jgi:succinyl-CoA:(S)-malate CoA-transferase subunit B
VPCGPIYSIDEIFADSHYHERGNLKTVRDSRIGELTVANVVPRLSETPGAVNSLGPTLGANNEEIYGQRLGLSSDHLAALAKKHVI